MEIPLFFFREKPGSETYRSAMVSRSARWLKLWPRGSQPSPPCQSVAIAASLKREGPVDGDMKTIALINMNNIYRVYIDKT